MCAGYAQERIEERMGCAYAHTRIDAVDDSFMRTKCSKVGLSQLHKRACSASVATQHHSASGQAVVHYTRARWRPHGCEHTAVECCHRMWS